jgi:hypothetical protein
MGAVDSSCLVTADASELELQPYRSPEVARATDLHFVAEMRT